MDGEFEGQTSTGGFEFEFVHTLSPSHTCSVCRLAMRKPVQTACGHRFCTSCFLEIFRYFKYNMFSFCKLHICVLSIYESKSLYESMSHESMSQRISVVTQLQTHKMRANPNPNPNYWNEGLGLINKLLLYWLWVSLTHLTHKTSILVKTIDMIVLRCCFAENGTHLKSRSCSTSIFPVRLIKL